MGNFEKFASIDTEAFVAQTRRKSGRLFFHHIPKTAGTFLVQQLQKTLPPYTNIFYTPELGGPTKVDGLADAVEVFLDECLATRYRVASGYLRQTHLRRIQEELPYTRVFTFLRNPVERVISEYRYTRTSKHPTHMQVREKYPDIESYIADPANQNRMWNLLAPKALQANEEGLNTIFRRHLFIGTLETLARNFAFLMGIFGYPKRPKTRSNTTQASSENTVQRDAELVLLIERVNAEDMALHSAVRRVLDDRPAEMSRFIEDRKRYYAAAEDSPTQFLGHADDERSS